MKLAVLGTFSTQFLVKSLKEINENLTIYESDYSQIDIEILNFDSGLYSFNPDFILIHETSISFRRNFHKGSGLNDRYYLNCISRLKMLLEKLNSQMPQVKVLYPILDFENDMSFGNFHTKVRHSIDFQLKKYNCELVDLTIENQNFFTIDINHLIFNQSNVRDHKLVVTSDLHFSISFTKVIAKTINQIICSSFGHFIKCVVVDLDNTIWGGVIGDDGLEGIQIGDLGIGKAFSEFQIWLKSLKERGIIICVCSKNEEKIAKNPFLNHPDMVLSLDDIAVFVANWENKVDNLMYIQEVLNIGFDSMVFIDDNIFERELVKKGISDIVVPDLPDDPSLYKSFLIDLNLFEITNFSNFDNERTKKYQAEDKRKKLYSSSYDLDEYLKSLHMKCSYENINKSLLPRVYQLIQRTNQFNARTIRYSMLELNNILDNKNFLSFCFYLSDDFGTHGLVALLILKKIDAKLLFIDTFIMSCRVFNRGLEYFIIDKIKVDIKKYGFESLSIEWIPTKKNKLVYNFYNSLGFNDFENKKSHLMLSKIKSKNYHINPV